MLVNSVTVKSVTVNSTLLKVTKMFDFKASSLPASSSHVNKRSSVLVFITFSKL